MELTVKIIIVVVYIYRNVFKDGKVVLLDLNKDWVDNLVIMFGFEDFMFYEMMRLYLVFYVDYEGGNVSVYIIYFVGSVLLDFYFCFVVGMNGFVGFLYGFVN